MITEPENYELIYADEAHYAETKLVVGGARTEYSESYIMSLSTSISLCGGYLSIGNAVVNRFQATLVNVLPTDIPVMTRVEIWCRLRNEDYSSGWFPKGVFYTKEPDYDPETRFLRVEGYDMMFLANQTPYPTGTITSWENETMRSVASTLSTVIGIDLEDPMQIEPYDFPAPPYGYSAREILSQIAIACGGNWMLTYVDASSQSRTAAKPLLRLRRFTDVTATQALGRTIQSFDGGSAVPSVTHVIIDYGINAQGATMYKEAVAQEDDGRTVEYDLSMITDGDVIQEIADDLLGSAFDFGYSPFTARGAMLDPLMEVGDHVTCNGYGAKLGAIDTQFGKGMVCSISCPGLPAEEAFPYMDSYQREADREKRTNATNSARITVNADAITAEVIRATSAESDLNDNIRSTITQTADSLTAEITEVATDLEGHATEQSQYVRYSASGLELGESSSSAKALLSPTGLVLVAPNDDIGAAIQQDPTDGNYKLFVYGGHFVNFMELGDHWYLIASGSDTDYRLTFKARG